VKSREGVLFTYRNTFMDSEAGVQRRGGRKKRAELGEKLGI